MIVKSFNHWQSLNENDKLDLKTDKTEEVKKKGRDKSNRKKYRKDNWISDSGAEYVLTKKREKDPDKDTYVLKGKNKKSPVWDENGKIVNDVKDFLTHDLMGGSNEGKYDEDSITMDKYKDGNRDRVKFSIALTKEGEEKKDTEEKKDAKTEGGKYKNIELPKNQEGETRIEIGEESEALPKIKELIRAAYYGKVTLGNEFGMDWLDGKKLEEKDINGWVIPFRMAFGMTSKNFISQGLVDEMVAQANKWESAGSAATDAVKDGAKEVAASSESRLFKFSDFVMISEDFDIALAQKEINKAAEVTLDTTKKEIEVKTNKTNVTDAVKTGAADAADAATTEGTEETTDEQAVAYRTWANSDEILKKAYGKPSQFDLDETGKNNSYVKRSITQAKADLDKKAGPMADEKYRTAFSALIGGKAATTEGEGYPMGYIQYKGTVNKWTNRDDNRIAVHLGNPRPKLGTIKAGSVVVFKDGWDAADFGYAVKDVWKDTSGNLGAIYIESPSYVKEFGKPNKDRNFEGKASIVVTDQMKTSNLKDMFVRNKTDDDMAIWVSNKINTFWTNASNFTSFKGTFNDNEAGAIALFTTWWNKNMAPNIQKLRKNDPNKDTLTGLFNTIITKAEGGTSNDTASWTISTMGGSKKYSVDTDF